MEMKKMIAMVLCLAIIFSLVGCGNKSVERVIGYSALYSEELINKAFDVIEKEFAKNFSRCTLTELKYDEEVENRFADLIEKYSIEAEEELIVVLSTFETDSKGGDGSLNPNDTYTNWQWHLVRTEDEQNWKMIDWGY